MDACLAAILLLAQTATPTVETAAARHRGDTADDSCIWIHPTDPSKSTIIADDKDGGVQVFGLDGKEIQFIDGDKEMNNLDIRYNFPLKGVFEGGARHERIALVGVGNEADESLAFYKVNPATRKIERAGSIRLDDAPYGGCLYRSPKTGAVHAFVNFKSGDTQQWELQDGGDGRVTGRKVREFDVGSQPEGCVADDIHAQFYIGEERRGIWKYGAEPGDGDARTSVDRCGSGGHLRADVEGLTIYYKTDGTGYLIASSQGNSTFVVYRREGKNEYIKTFKVGSNGDIDRVTDTDGIDVVNLPLGPAFPKGLFVAHDNSNSGARASNHKLVPWESVANAGKPVLSIDTTWDPRRVGASPERR